jgi:hypothetical protein
MHPARLVLRHLSGDWGQVSDKRRRINLWLAQGHCHRRFRAPRSSPATNSDDGNYWW